MAETLASQVVLAETVEKVDSAGNMSDWSGINAFDIVPLVPSELSGNGEKLSWTGVAGAGSYVVEYSKDGFATTFSITVTSCSLDTFGIPAGKYQWRVCAVENSRWVKGNDFTVDRQGEQGKLLSNANGVQDIFFAAGTSVWGSGFAAQHLGNGSWQGTGERVELQGKSKITGIFAGSTDANILVLSDSAGGDALFIDDIFTASGDQIRFSQINEICGGDGNDIIDMTSLRFDYSGVIRIYGGSGDDIIWGGAEKNILYGDSGNDKLTGSYGDDILAGGSGDDTMHGGGGNDIFCFGANWGSDIVEQLPGDGSTVTLWFAAGSLENWDSEHLVYTDGENSVAVTGCTCVDVKFGSLEEAPEGVFAAAVTDKIFR